LISAKSSLSANSVNCSTLAPSHWLAVVLLDLPGDLVDILPVIAIFGEIRGLAKELHVACPHGLPQKLHLPSGVVVVILSRHVVAGVL
jgi:hypothetical protein